MKTGRSLSELAMEIERRANAKRDLIAPVSKLAMVAEQAIVGGPQTVALAVTNGKQERFGIQPTAHEQLATYTGIPTAYYRRLQDNDPGLLAVNVNRWLGEQGTDRRMVRTLDGKVRALLSDRYRPLENEELAEAVLPVLLDRKLMIMSCEITDRRLYIKAVDSSIEKDVPTGKRIGDGSHVFFDTVSPGITISNSEVGAGSLSIETTIYTKMCTNLAMMGRPLRKYHSGSRADVSEEVYALLTDSTKRLTDAAVWGQVKDIVASAFDAARFEAQASKLGDAAQQPIVSKDVPEVIERVGKRFALREGERLSVLDQLIRGGDLTRYGVHAAITRAAQDVEDYDRATELERLGGEVIDLAPGDWKVLAAA